MHLNAGVAIFCGDLLQAANGQHLFNNDPLESSVHRLQIFRFSDDRNAHVPELVPSVEKHVHGKVGFAANIAHHCAIDASLSQATNNLV